MLAVVREKMGPGIGAVAPFDPKNPPDPKSIEFVVKDSLGTSVRLWVVREVVLAILTCSLLIFTSWAIANSTSLSNVFQLNVGTIPRAALITLTIVGSIAAFRIFIWRPFIGWAGVKVTYEMENKRYNSDASWEEVPPIHLKTYDDKIISGRFQELERSKKVTIYCEGNAALYDEYPNRCPDPTSLFHFHPPGYGKSQGPRNPQSDFFALEAVILYLHKEKKYDYSCMILDCNSLGTGMGIAICSKYPIGKLQLNVPFASIATVAKRKAYQLLNKNVARVANWFLEGALHDYFDYRSVVNMGKTQAEVIEIHEGGQDDLMTLSEFVTPEAHLLVHSYLVANPKIGDAIESENTELETTKYISQERTLTRFTYKKEGHNLARMMKKKHFSSI